MRALSFRARAPDVYRAAGPCCGRSSPRYFPVAPEAWSFAPGEHGKPFIVSPITKPPLHFNLTRTDGLVACVVSAAGESIGVEAERLDRGGEIFEDAARYFSAAEREALRSCPAEDRARLFFAWWTLKESYLKARGAGLTLPLDRICFDFGNNAIGLVLEKSLGEDGASWQFALLQPSAHHLIAVAARTLDVALTLRVRRTVPLGETAGEEWLAPDSKFPSAFNLGIIRS